MKRVRVGILGTGTVVRDFHLPALLSNARAEVVALGNLRQPSLETLASEHKIAKTYSDFDHMAADNGIDAVVNALPNYLHAPATIVMLRAGKHVLCEKPMATTVADAQAMVAAAKEYNRKLMIAHVWRCDGEAQWLRDIVRSGRVGPIREIRAHAVVSGRGPRKDGWFVDAEAAGGGALADVGVHVLDTISFLFDDRVKPLVVSARTANRFPQLAVEDTASASIEYDNQMTAQIEAGWYGTQVTQPHGAIELFGAGGYARILPAQLQLLVDGLWQDQHPSLSAGHPDSNVSIYADQVDRFLDCVLEDRQPPCDGRAALQSVIILDAAYRSAACGRSVAVCTDSEACKETISSDRLAR